MPRISELAAIAALDEDDILVIVEDGTAKKVTVEQLRAALGKVEEIVVGAGGASAITFQTIPTGGKHLRIEAHLQCEADVATWAGIRFNNSSSGYYWNSTYVKNNDSTVNEVGNSDSQGRIGFISKSSAAQGSMVTVHIPFYRGTALGGQTVARAESGTHTDGTYITRTTSTGGGSYPLTRIDLVLVGGGDFKVNSTATLYVE